MKNFIEALQKSLDTENWYSVLFISLTLPDICGKIEYPGLRSKERTIKWYKKYLEQSYTIKYHESTSISLTGTDFYALRCALFHSGQDDITGRGANEVLDNFVFIQPSRSGVHIHNNTYNNSLQLQVDQFGKDVLEAVKNWLKEIECDRTKMSKIDNMLTIKSQTYLSGIVY